MYLREVLSHIFSVQTLRVSVKVYPTDNQPYYNLLHARSLIGSCDFAVAQFWTKAFPLL